MRIVAVFEKGERIRHIGHLDIQRAVQRGLRRSDLPVAYSAGFNPHILVSFASALSTGASGKREIMDVGMAGEVTAQEFIERMNRAMPPEMQISEARLVEDRHPAMMALLTAASYDLTVYGDGTAETLIRAIPGLLARDIVPAMRKTKTGLKECDIRPLIYQLKAEGNTIRAVLALTEREACKPNMLIAALKEEAGITDDPRILTVRTQLYGTGADGKLQPLETL